MNSLLRIAASCVCAFALSGHAATPQPVSSIVVMPWDVSQNRNLPQELTSRGFNHATVYLNWTDIEPRKGQFEFAHYHSTLDTLVKNGLSLIVVLDMGGRPYLDQTGKEAPDSTTVPAWVYTDHKTALMKNFSGALTWQPDFTDPNINLYRNRFISKTVDHLSGRYPGKILGYAIGLQEEHEIKYGQTGYQWRDFKESTQSDFSRKHGALQPVINYNNEIARGTPKAEPLLYAHKEYRENRLRDATCAYSKVIREKGAAAMGYFAEVFTSHDAIYATGVVEKLADCLDIAVIDFNFSDGYNLVPDADILPVLANYMGSLGYKKILVGAYAENWVHKNRTAELIPVISRSLSRSLTQDRVIGFELGGFQRQVAAGQSATIDMDKLGSIAIPSGNAKPPTAERRIGILGSATNYYVWHGERSHGRNTHQDALYESFKLLSSQPGIDVRLIGEKNLLQDDPLVQTLDAILVPHQAALPLSIKAKLTAFWKNGGALVQDMRLGEFDENGQPTFDWMHEVFGIESIEWKRKSGIFLIDGGLYRLKPSPRLYTGFASMTAREGYKVLGSEIFNRNQGILVRGERTLAFGFLPQLVEDQTREDWRKLFVGEILKVLPPQSRAGTPVRQKNR